MRQMPAGDADVLHREMGCTRDEFLAWLPGATRGAAIRTGSDTARVSVGAGEVDIMFGDEPARRIGAVSIPVFRVTFRFAGVDRASREAFLKYFDLHTRRGGG